MNLVQLQDKLFVVYQNSNYIKDVVAYMQYIAGFVVRIYKEYSV